MKVAPFIFVVLAATLSVSAHQPTGGKPGNTVNVEIVIGTKGDEAKPCSVVPTTVYVIGTTPYHCIDKKLISHAEEGKNKALEASYVKLAAGDRIQWNLKSHLFTISDIEAHTPIVANSPGNPFNGNFSDKPANTVLSGVVVNVEGSVVQQYKVTFNIVGVGLVDPDVVCSM